MDQKLGNALQTLEARFRETEKALETCKTQLAIADRNVQACKRIIRNVVNYMKQDVAILQELNNAEDNAIFASINDDDPKVNRSNDSGFMEHISEQ